MFELNASTLLGLKQMPDGSFRPRRVSMFPPSYAQRALARQVKRQGVRDVEAPALVAAPAPAPASDADRPTDPPPQPGGMVTSGHQTDVSYCYHECACHPLSNAPNGPTGGGGKKGDKGKSPSRLCW